MNQHRVTYEGADDGWQAKCTCRSRSPLCGSRQEAEDWAQHHTGQVERARAASNRGSQTLHSAYRYYQEQADRSDLDRTERDQWQELADEIGGRLGIGRPGQNDQPLF